MSASKRFSLKALLGAAAFAGALVTTGQAHAAATIIINNINAPGVGFNDPTPATPVGGNTGTTVGQQRLIAFTYAANIWGATLTSNVPIVINAQFTPLTCSATSGVLGSAGATQIFRDFAGATKPATWFNYALANKLAGADLGAPPAPQINSNFNSNLGTTGCLQASGWYYGLDSNEGTLIDFVAVLQHEMAHGLGFQTFTNGSSGAQNGGFPAIWDHFLFGTAAGKLWKDMTNAERAASAISVNGLVWTGANVNAALPSVLRMGQAAIVVSGAGAGSAVGTYIAGDSTLGPAVLGPSISGQIMPVVEQGTGTGAGCLPFNDANTRAVNGRIALIDRGICGFAIKAKNAQNAGAIGVIIVNNTTGALAPGGSDATVTIPVLGMTQADGTIIKSALNTRSRARSGVTASFTVVGTQYTGADPLGRALMFAPNPFQGGSSVSHFDSSMFRNQLMEPAINPDLTQSVLPPIDLTFRLFQDIGW
ncbi:PA domain-containing protein [Rubrivivax rivuli]|uniref:Peptidase n=1 Tax=Rubrivivax rivuli TaxID=1862385 RepID=A0A437RC10_9BURK|nr:PA domain-containing protein [Rubrivivax rivuli]RVU44295.1 peptidase [Rubrivivax rivuli]